MLSLKQIGTICFVFSLILISQKSYSDIAANNSNPSCDNSTLNTYTGPAALEAKWNANTIQLKWYKDDELLTVQTAANQCTYDGTMTLPSTRPTKTGYDFNGWKVKTGGVSGGSGLMCGLTDEILLVEPSHYWTKGWDNSSNESYCMTENASVSCSSNAIFNDLNTYAWKVQTSTGMYEGIASCNNDAEESSASQQAEFEAAMASIMADAEPLIATYGENAFDVYETMTPEHKALADSLLSRLDQAYAVSIAKRSADTFSSSVSGRYCWCKATSYTPNGEGQCSLASLSWVFGHDHLSEDFCSLDCASHCALNVKMVYAFRSAVLGAAGN